MRRAIGGNRSPVGLTHSPTRLGGFSFFRTPSHEIPRRPAGPAIDDDEDDDQDTAPQGLLSAPFVQQAIATGLLGYDGAAAQQAPATDSGPDDPRDAGAAFPVPFNPLATLQGIPGANYFIDSNADMQERQQDRPTAASGGASPGPMLSLGDDELARENYLLRNKATTPPPSPFDLERQYKRDNVSPAVPQFVDHGRPQDVSTPSLELLNRIARDAGLDIGQLQVTSGLRTAADQARIMYDALANNQDMADYGKPGQELIGIFHQGERAGDSPRTIQDRMTQRAQELLEQGTRVSNHMGDPRELNVFDIGLSSVPADKRQAFQAALMAAKARGTCATSCHPTRRRPTPTPSIWKSTSPPCVRT